MIPSAIHDPIGYRRYYGGLPIKAIGGAIVGAIVACLGLGLVFAVFGELAWPLIVIGGLFYLLKNYVQRES